MAYFAYLSHLFLPTRFSTSIKQKSLLNIFYFSGVWSNIKIKLEHLPNFFWKKRSFSPKEQQQISMPGRKLN